MVRQYWFVVSYFQAQQGGLAGALGKRRLRRRTWSSVRDAGVASPSTMESTEEQGIACGPEEVTQEQPQRAAGFNPGWERLSNAPVLIAQHGAVCSADQAVKPKLRAVLLRMRCPSPAVVGFQGSTHPASFPCQPVFPRKIHASSWS